jgi:hypothetical protein
MAVHLLQPPEGPQRVDGRWLQVGDGAPVDIEVAFPAVKVNGVLIQDPIKTGRNKVTWAFRNDSWTLQEGSGLIASWKNASGEKLVWVREITQSLDHLCGDWMGINGAAVTVTAGGVVYIDGARMSHPVELSSSKLGSAPGKIKWLDNRPMAWFVDYEASTPMRLVWKLDSKEGVSRVVNWQRPLANPESFPGPWHASDVISDDAELFVEYDSRKVWRKGPADTQSRHMRCELEFTSFGVFLTEQPTGDPFAVWIPPQDSSPRRLWEVDMSKCSRARVHWFATDDAPGSKTWIRWFRCAVPKGLSPKTEEAQYNIHVIHVADEGWKKWQNTIVNNLHICKREFKHDGVTNFGVTKDHVRKLVEPNGVLDHKLSWMVVIQVQEQITCFALAHEIARLKAPLENDYGLDRRRMYLDVICASKDAPSPPGLPKWGDIALKRLENLAREQGYPVLELGSLNVWLTENYYKKRDFVEKDYPTSGAREERKPKYSIPENPWTVSEEKLEAYKLTYKIVANDERKARQLLEQRTWCGFRMTKDLEGTVVTVRDPRSVGAVKNYPATKRPTRKREFGAAVGEVYYSPPAVGKGGKSPKGDKGKAPKRPKLSYGCKGPHSPDTFGPEAGDHGYGLRPRPPTSS